MEGDSENTLRESVGIVCSSEDLAKAKFREGAGRRSSEGVRGAPGLTINQIVVPRQSGAHTQNG